MGMTLGLAMEGFIPISIYPRWNFLILALNQLVNHVDKLNEMGNGGFENRIIIRTGIGSSNLIISIFLHIVCTAEVKSLSC